MTKILFILLGILTFAGCRQHKPFDVQVVVRDSESKEPVINARVDLDFVRGPLDFGGPGAVGHGASSDNSGIVEYQFVGDGLWMITVDAFGYDVADNVISVPSDISEWQLTRIRRLHPSFPQKTIEYKVITSSSE